MMELLFSGPFVPGTFVLKTIRSLEHSFPGPFVPGTVRSLDHSFPRRINTANLSPRTVRSLDRSFPGTFVPGTLDFSCRGPFVHLSELLGKL